MNDEGKNSINDEPSTSQTSCKPTAPPKKKRGGRTLMCARKCVTPVAQNDEKDEVNMECRAYERIYPSDFTLSKEQCSLAIDKEALIQIAASATQTIPLILEKLEERETPKGSKKRKAAVKANNVSAKKSPPAISPLKVTPVATPVCEVSSATVVEDAVMDVDEAPVIEKTNGKAVKKNNKSTNASKAEVPVSSKKKENAGKEKKKLSACSPPIAKIRRVDTSPTPQPEKRPITPVVTSSTPAPSTPQNNDKIIGTPTPSTPQKHDIDGEDDCEVLHVNNLSDEEINKHFEATRLLSAVSMNNTRIQKIRQEIESLRAKCSSMSLSTKKNIANEDNYVGEYRERFPREDKTCKNGTPKTSIRMFESELTPSAVNNNTGLVSSSDSENEIVTETPVHKRKRDSSKNCCQCGIRMIDVQFNWLDELGKDSVYCSVNCIDVIVQKAFLELGSASLQVPLIRQDGHVVPAGPPISQLKEFLKQCPDYTPILSGATKKVEKPTIATPPVAEPKLHSKGSDQIRFGAKKIISDTLLTRVKRTSGCQFRMKDCKNVAEKIEQEVFKVCKQNPTGQRYKTWMKAFLLQVKEIRNKGFFYRILSGKLTVEKVAALEPSELSSSEYSTMPAIEAPASTGGLTEENKPSCSEPSSEKGNHNGQNGKPTPTTVKHRANLASFTKPASAIAAPKSTLDALLDDQRDTTGEHMSHFFDKNCQLCASKINDTLSSKLPGNSSYKATESYPDSLIRPYELEYSTTVLEVQHQRIPATKHTRGIPITKSEADKEKRDREDRDRVRDDRRKYLELYKTNEVVRSDVSSPCRSRFNPQDPLGIADVDCSNRDGRDSAQLNADGLSDDDFGCGGGADDDVVVDVVGDQPIAERKEESWKNPSFHRDEVWRTETKHHESWRRPSDAEKYRDERRRDQKRSPEKSSSRSHKTSTPVKKVVDPWSGRNLTVWNGLVQMGQAVFTTSLEAVSNPAILDVCDDLPPILKVKGRIPPLVAFDYLSTLRSSRDVMVLHLFRPLDLNSDQHFSLLLEDMISKDRYLVFDMDSSSSIKDGYLMPVLENMEPPAVLLPYDGPGISSRHPTMIICVLVMRRNAITNKSDRMKETSEAISKRHPRNVSTDEINCRMIKLEPDESSQNDRNLNVSDSSKKDSADIDRSRSPLLGTEATKKDSVISNQDNPKIPSGLGGILSKVFQSRNSSVEMAEAPSTQATPPKVDTESVADPENIEAGPAPTGSDSLLPTGFFNLLKKDQTDVPTTVVPSPDEIRTLTEMLFFIEMNNNARLMKFAVERFIELPEITESDREIVGKKVVEKVALMKRKKHERKMAESGQNSKEDNNERENGAKPAFSMEDFDSFEKPLSFADKAGEMLDMVDTYISASTSALQSYSSKSPENANSSHVCLPTSMATAPPPPVPPPPPPPPPSKSSKSLTEQKNQTQEASACSSTSSLSNLPLPMDPPPPPPPPSADKSKFRKSAYPAPVPPPKSLVSAMSPRAQPNAPPAQLSGKSESMSAIPLPPVSLNNLHLAPPPLDPGPPPPPPPPPPPSSTASTVSIPVPATQGDPPSTHPITRLQQTTTDTEDLRVNSAEANFGTDVCADEPMDMDESFEEDTTGNNRNFDAEKEEGEYIEKEEEVVRSANHPEMPPGAYGWGPPPGTGLFRGQSLPPRGFLQARTLPPSLRQRLPPPHILRAQLAARGHKILPPRGRGMLSTPRGMFHGPPPPARRQFFHMDGSSRSPYDRGQPPPADARPPFDTDQRPPAAARPQMNTGQPPAAVARQPCDMGQHPERHMPSSWFGQEHDLQSPQVPPDYGEW